MVPTNRPPNHPGRVLLEEFLIPMGISQVELAQQMGVPIQRINTFVNGKRSCSAETALLLSKILKTTPEFWLNLQNACDLYVAQSKLQVV
jgi:antitoxin HigA-1